MTGAHEAGYSPGPQDGTARDMSDVSAGQLISDISRDMSTLMRQEVELAKVELKHEAVKAGKGAGMLGGAGLAGYFLALFLSIALWEALSSFMPRGWAALIVAVLWGAVAAVLFVQGRKQLKQVNPKPEQTVETIQEIPSALKPETPPTNR